MNIRDLKYNAGRYRSFRKKGLLSEHQIHQLNEIGFVWNWLDHRWNVNYNLLVQFKNENGHMNVPQSDKKLWGWIQHQRSGRKKKRLSPEQITKLDSLGFIWLRHIRAGQKLIDVCPDLIKQWDVDQNTKMGLDIKTITIGHQKIKVYWICEKNPSHKWAATVNQRTNTAISNGKGSGCPYCSGQKVSLDNCLVTTHPEYAKQWHPTKNGSLTPYDVTAGSSRQKVWWICANGKHELFMTPYEVTSKNRKYKGSGCKYCSNQEACHDNCLDTLFPQIAKEWYQPKNGNIKPTDVIPSSTMKKYWWKCSICKTTIWKQSCYARTQLTSIPEVGCSECRKKTFRDRYNQDLPFEECILHTHSEVCKEIDYSRLGDINLKRVRSGSSTLKLPWVCSTCNHKWDAVVSNRCKGIGCPKCGIEKTRIKRMETRLMKNNLAKKHPKVAREWHPLKNTITPDKITSGNNQHVWWLCSKCGREWEATVYNRAIKKQGCKSCAMRKKCS